MEHKSLNFWSKSNGSTGWEYWTQASEFWRIRKVGTNMFKSNSCSSHEHDDSKAPVFHRDRIVKSPTLRVVRGINGNPSVVVVYAAMRCSLFEWCGNGHHHSRVLLHFWSSTIYFHQAPSLGRGRVASTNQP